MSKNYVNYSRLHHIMQKNIIIVIIVIRGILASGLSNGLSGDSNPWTPSQEGVTMHAWQSLVGQLKTVRCILFQYFKTLLSRHSSYLCIFLYPFTKIFLLIIHVRTTCPYTQLKQENPIVVRGSIFNSLWANLMLRNSRTTQSIRMYVKCLGIWR